MLWAAPASFTYQGRIVKSDNSPLNYNNVSFQFEITTANGQCILYREQVDHVDMTNSGGVFDVPIGGGVQSFPGTGSFSLLDAFNNSVNLNCDGGAVYTGSSGDVRKLRVKFHDGVGWQVISPDNIIRSVPYSAYSFSAEKIGNKTLGDIVVKTDINGNASCGSGNFLTWNSATQSFGCSGVTGASGGTVTNVSSANAYLTVTNGSASPLLTLNVGSSSNTVAAGNDPRFVDSRAPSGNAGGDLGGTFPNPSVVKIQGSDVSNVAPSNGQFFKFSGTKWTASAIAISDVTNLSSTLAGYQTQAAFNLAVGSANCAAYETPYWSSVSGKFLCQAINVSLAGDASGTIGAVSVDKIKGYSVDLSVAPTVGQVLKYDGTKWTAGADNNGGGTVTNVTGSAPISVINNSTTPAISISQATTSTNGYLSSGDWNTFNNKQAAGNYITALTGDVTASGPNSATATVAKLQGSTLTLTAPANKDYLKFNGTAFVNSLLAASDLSGAIPAANMPAFTGDVTSSAGTTVLSLPNVGTAGTYYKVITDVKGRVTAGSSTLVASDIPNLDWSKITSGKPTTLSGYGITDSLVGNIGGTTPSMQTGLDASKPGSPSAGAVYLATDTKIIYQYNGGSWVNMASANGSGGTITGVTAGAGLSGGGASGAVTLNLANTAVSAGSYTRANITVDAQGRITSAANGAAVNLTSEVTGTLPIANGGTGATTALSAMNALSPLATKGDVLVRDGTNNIRLAVGTDGQVLSADSSQASGLKWMIPTNGTVTNVTGSAPIVVTTGSTTPAISVNVATAASLGVVQVGAGIAVNGSGIISADPANFPSAVPVTKGGTGVTSFTANRLIASNGTGSTLTPFTCPLGQTISFDAAGIVGCSTFTTAGVFVNGGNSFGVNATLGTNDANNLSFKTNNTTAMTIDSSGRVGIGLSPGAPLHVLNAAAFENNSSTSSGPTFSFWKSRGYTADLNNDELGFISFYGHDGAGIYRSSYIASHVDATPSIGTHTVRGRLEFYTTGAGNSDSTERMRIDSSGNVGIGTSSPVSILQVGGNNLTVPSWTTQGSHLYIPGVTSTDSTGSGTIASRTVASIGTHTFAAANAETITTASTLLIASSPSAGTNVTITNPLALQVGSGNSAFLGNVGAGTTSPMTTLHVSEPSLGAGARGISNELITSSSTGGPGLGMYRARGTAAAKTAVQASDGLGYIWASGYNGTSYPLPSNPIGIYFYTTEAWDASHGGGGMSFVTTANGATNGATRMTISSNGGVGIGTTTPSTLLHVSHSTGLTAGTVFDSPYGQMQFFPGWSDSYAYIEIGNSNFTANSNGLRLTGYNGNPMPALYLTATNTYYTGTLTSSSDIRLKENVKPLDGALEKALKIPGVSFDWKNPERRKEQGRQIGVIAQDVEKQFPELVKEMDNADKDATLKKIKTVDYSHLSAVVLQAIHEFFAKWSQDSRELHAELAVQKRQISSVQKDNAQLRKENDDLKKRLDAIEKKLSSK